MSDTKTPEQKWDALRAPFKDDEIEYLPKPYKKDSPKGKCSECGGYHGLPAVHLSYVGHGTLTMRLNDVLDPGEWDWEPFALAPDGSPLVVNGNLWIRLTILGITKIGVGDADNGKGVKEMIGDALRNAAMRHGIATYLWSKSDKAKAELMKMGVEESAPAQGESAIGSDAPIVRAIYGKKKALDMTDDQLTAAIKRDFGKEHPGDLTMTEAKALADKMQTAINAKEEKE